MDDLSLTNRPMQLAELLTDLFAEWARFVDEDDCWDEELGRGLDQSEWLAMKLADRVLLRDQLEQVGWMSFFDDGHPSYASFTTEPPNDVGETLVPVYRMKE